MPLMVQVPRRTVAACGLEEDWTSMLQEFKDTMFKSNLVPQSSSPSGRAWGHRDGGRETRFVFPLVFAYSML